MIKETELEEAYDNYCRDPESKKMKQGVLTRDEWVAEVMENRHEG